METKPAVQTTEFWVTILTAILMTLNTTDVIDAIPTTWSTIALAIITAAYTISRGQAKQGVAYTPPVPPAEKRVR